MTVVLDHQHPADDREAALVVAHEWGEVDLPHPVVRELRGCRDLVVGPERESPAARAPRPGVAMTRDRALDAARDGEVRRLRHVAQHEHLVNGWRQRAPRVHVAVDLCRSGVAGRGHDARVRVRRDEHRVDLRVIAQPSKRAADPAEASDGRLAGQRERAAVPGQRDALPALPARDDGECGAPVHGVAVAHQRDAGPGDARGDPERADVGGCSADDPAGGAGLQEGLGGRRRHREIEAVVDARVLHVTGSCAEARRRRVRAHGSRGGAREHDCEGQRRTRFRHEGHR
jgi:hypothetical protein